MVKGFSGKILRVDLSTGKTWVEQPDERFTAATWAGKDSSATTCSKKCPRARTPWGRTIC